MAENKETNASMSEQPRPVNHAVFPSSVSQVDGTHCCDAPPYLRSIFMGTRNDPRIVSANFLEDTLGVCNQSPSLCTQHLHVTTTGEPPLFHQIFRAALQ